MVLPPPLILLLPSGSLRKSLKGELLLPSGNMWKSMWIRVWICRDGARALVHFIGLVDTRGELYGVVCLQR